MSPVESNVGMVLKEEFCGLSGEIAHTSYS